jgi:hypothetical protein
VVVWIGVVGMPAATLVALAHGARPVGLRSRTTAAIVIAAGVAWAGWLGGSVVLSEAGVYRATPTTANPWIGVVLLVVAAAVLLAARIPAAARILADAGTTARLAVPQMFRVVGGTFLIVAAFGELPAVFAVPAGFGDIAVGVSAPFVAWRLSRRGYHHGAVWFNVLGIIDLVVAVSIGFLAAPGSTNLLSVTPSTEAIAVLPLVLIPTTAVPLAVALHILSLRRLRAMRHAVAPTTEPAVPVAG